MKSESEKSEMNELGGRPEPASSEPTPENFAVGVFREIRRFLSSSRLAMALLVAILACCVAGVTLFRPEEAWRQIFNALWFNGLLVLLVINVAFCFFGRIWGRKVTVISLGMILFHLSFVFILCGIVYNSFFYFRGVMRLTEGETLPNGVLESYDSTERGSGFDLSRLKGETSLIKMHSQYLVDGENKKAAYEIAVGTGSLKQQGIIYITRNLDHNGFTYLADKEGYSLLVILYDKEGNEIYGAHVPLQSLKQKDNTFLYTFGTREGPGLLPFPQIPLMPLFELQITYHPSPTKERSGDVSFQIWPLASADGTAPEKPSAEGQGATGEKMDAGQYNLEVREVRYWVGMNVRYDPGKPIVLTSLWTGFGGVVLTFFGRLWGRKGATAVTTGEAETEGTSERAETEQDRSTDADSH